MQKKTFRNESIQIASHHLLTAKQEVTECADQVYEKLQQLLSLCQDEQSHKLLTQAMAALQFQDILTQRLDRLSHFLEIIDQRAEFGADKKYLEEFAWENEVEQSDIDEMFDEYKKG